MPSERYPRTDTLTTHLPTPKGWAAELVSSYSKQFQWLEWNPGPPTSQPYALNIWPHCDIYPFTQGHCKLCFHKMIKKSKKCTGCPKQKSCIWSTKDKKPLFQFLKYILFWINKALLTLFGQGFLPVWKDLGGGQNAPPPPVLTWLFQVRWWWNLARIYYGEKSLQIDKKFWWCHHHVDFIMSSKCDSQ